MWNNDRNVDQGVNDSWVYLNHQLIFEGKINKGVTQQYRNNNF